MYPVYRRYTNQMYPVYRRHIPWCIRCTGVPTLPCITYHDVSGVPAKATARQKAAAQQTPTTIAAKQITFDKFVYITDYIVKQNSTSKSHLKQYNSGTTNSIWSKTTQDSGTPDISWFTGKIIYRSTPNISWLSLCGYQIHHGSPEIDAWVYGLVKGVIIHWII